MDYCNASMFIFQQVYYESADDDDDRLNWTYSLTVNMGSMYQVYNLSLTITKEHSC